MSNATGSAISMILALFTGILGIIITIVGLSGAVSGDEMSNTIRLLMWALTIAGGLMIYGALSMFFGAKKKMEDTARDEKKMTQAAVKALSSAETVQSLRAETKKGFPVNNTILIRWTYNDEEWKEYTRKEFRYRIREAIILWVLLTGMGTWLLADYRDMGHLTAFLSSFGLGAIVTFIRYLIANNARNANSAKPGEVVISAKSILINGKYHTLNDEMKTMSKVKLLKDEKPLILEFSVNWNTRKGPTNEQIRVPVPEGKTEDAQKLVKLFYDEIIGRY